MYDTEQAQPNLSTLDGPRFDFKFAFDAKRAYRASNDSV